MGKKRKIRYLRERIMIDIDKINLLLELIVSRKIENLKDACVLASIALAKSKRIDKNNEKIGTLLG